MMYSDEIAGFLKKHGIKTGDHIRVEYSGVTIEGELMPKTEVGSPDTLTVKLKSGYNVGVAFEGATVTKIAESEGPVAFPTAKLGEDKGLPKVSLIITGGTIVNKIDYKTGGVHPVITPEELLYDVPELSKIARISIRNPFSMASEDISYREWGVIANEVASELNGGARGAVVAMGTDTMHYASAALGFMLQGLNAPVVVTGAQRSSDRGSSDAFMNLICSAHIAAKSDIAEVGICMHRSSSDDECQFIRGTKARKMHSTRRDAFRPVNDSAIAYVKADGRIRYGSQHRKMSGKSKASAMTKFESKVALVTAYPNSDPELIDFYVKRGYRGIIIEGTGMGHVPVLPSNVDRSWMDYIAQAIKKGVVVGMTTQTLYGRVNTNVYSNLRKISELGVVYCEDMLPETAYVKLGWLLGNYSPKKAGEMLNKNIVGEISQRTELGEFLV